MQLHISQIKPWDQKKKKKKKESDPTKHMPVIQSFPSQFLTASFGSRPGGWVIASPTNSQHEIIMKI